MSARFYIETLGCPKNQVDSDKLVGTLLADGLEPTGDAREADVVVVNTCAFIDTARQESIDTILELAEHKRSGRCTRLVVTGCLAERYRDELKAEIPEIDVVLGTGELPGIVDAVGGVTPKPLKKLARKKFCARLPLVEREDARLRPGMRP